MNNSGGLLDNQTWQTKWKTAPLAKVQLYGYGGGEHILDVFVTPSHFCANFDWPAIFFT